jgi:Tol biopolymer transport system component
MRSNAALITLFLGLSATLCTCQPLPAQAPAPPRFSTPSAPAEKNPNAQITATVAHLADRLKASPIKPTTAVGRVGLYLIDLSTGELVLIADQPDSGLTHCGSPTWSHDGRRILYDATPGTEWTVTHLKSIAVVDNQLQVDDLGNGNCPVFSPNDQRIAFLSNAAGVETGIWMMNADGSNRSPLGDYGRPRWSPDGRQLLIVSFGNPCQLTLMDADPDKSGPIQLPDLQFFSVPSWTKPSTILAVTGKQAGDCLALIDVSKPADARVEKILWKRSEKLDIEPSYPVFCPVTRRYVFVGGEAKGLALYTFTEGDTSPPKRLEPDGVDTIIVSLAFSPDGRYLLFNSDRTDRHSRPPAKPGAASKPN